MDALEHRLFDRSSGVFGMGKVTLRLVSTGVKGKEKEEIA